jgi:acetate kinase
MKILVINCGSSSIKYRLFQVQSGELTDRTGGTVSNLNQEKAVISHQAGERCYEKRLDHTDYLGGFEAIIEALLDPEHGVLEDISEIGAVGHRTVHGGNRFTGAVLIDEEVMAKMRECIPLAPLHNPPNIMGIEQARRLLPRVRQAAVFDTAFHQTLPPRAFMYSLPYRYYEQYGVRKFGFHGTSCDYVSGQAARLMKRELAELRLIICHLGNGASVTAVQGGRSIDTSLGFTPLEGVMMGARCGDLDPGVVLFLQRELGLDLKQVDRILNQESGLLGISGVSNDLRPILESAENGEARCGLALEMFTYRIKKYIGAYAAALGGLDGIVFTGGMGENSALVRAWTLENLQFLAIELDPELNHQPSKQSRFISRENSRVAVAVIPTNEELMIARETLALVEPFTYDCRQPARPRPIESRADCDQAERGRLP